jgi:hypothetical protein
MRLPAVLLPVLAALSLGSCDSAARPLAVSRIDESRPAPERIADSASFAPGAAPSLEAMWAEDKLIRSAELRILVPGVRDAIDRADSLVRSMGAFIADTRVTQAAKERSDARITIRVPAGQFTRVVGALRTLGRVESESLGTEDVTKAYADVQTRLAVKEEEAGRLRTLLATRTGKLSDVLDLERELSRVVTEIEQLKGEHRYYDERIAVSTIVLFLYEPGAILRPGTADPILAAFRSALAVLATSVAYLVYAITFLAPWALLATLVFGSVRRLRARSREA